MADGEQVTERALISFGVSLYPSQMEYVDRLAAIYGMSKSHAVRHVIDRLQEAERELAEMRNATIWKHAKDCGLTYVDAMNQMAAEWVDLQRRREAPGAR